MKIIKKMGYGVLSLTTLFFASLSNGFPNYRIFGSIKSKIDKTVLKNGGNAPEKLVLQQANSPYADEIINDASHRSHSSHRSHASHRSGTTGRVVSRPETTKTTSETSDYTNAYAQYLTAADVEMISGLKGIQRTLEPTILHFLQSNGKEILRVKFSGKEDINTYKSDSKYSPISGLGEVALVGTLQLPMELMFAKGKYCVEILTFPKEGLNLFLSLDQLKTVANYILSRLLD